MPTITTFARLRPATKPGEGLEVTEDEPDIVKATVIPDSATGSGDKNKVQYQFKFSKVFDATSTQEDVFEGVGRKACESFLSGFNATIFAYGQTGSGKTFTIEGGSKRFEDRGLLPRCLQMIYDTLNERPDYTYTMQVTYLEIYNNIAYDLLNAASGSNARLPKVTVKDTGQTCRIQNLSVHIAPTFDVAQSLLFMGRSNRTVAKTSMNLASSRSHSIFTITVTAQKNGSEIITKSKLNLVDLAGSERVSKSGAKGSRLSEAKHINLSLHYLEAVIIALQQRKSKQHIPYRNSLLTKLLRDSLGGNCVTVMIANLSHKDSNLHESISTCRFAQRVALVDNSARRNELLDDKTIIKRLRKRIAELQAELALANEVANEARGKAEEEFGSGTEIDRKRCGKIVNGYLHHKVTDPLAAVPSAHAVRYCLELLKGMVLEQREQIAFLQGVEKESEQTEEKLRTLQAKFGVTRAQMRNMEATIIPTSGYGAAKSKPGASPAKKVKVRRERPLSPQSKRRAKIEAEIKAKKERKSATKSKKQSLEDRRQEAKQQAEVKLKQLEKAEQDTRQMLKKVTDRVKQQHGLVRLCEEHAPHRYEEERVAALELEQEQVYLAEQLGELRELKKQIQDSYEQLKAVPTTSSTTSANSLYSEAKKGSSKKATVSSTASSRGPHRSIKTSSSSLSVSSSSFAFNGQETQRSISGSSLMSSERKPKESQPPRTARTQKTPKNKNQTELEKREAATRDKLKLLKQQLMEEEEEERSRESRTASATSHAYNQQADESSRLTSASSSTSSMRFMNSLVNGNARVQSGDSYNRYQPPPRVTAEVDLVDRYQFEGVNSMLSSTDSRHSSARSFRQPVPQQSTTSNGWITSPVQPPITRVANSSPSSSRQRQPEERYMSAVQKQRNRVSQIRETIKAATVIQRAWRKYKRRSAR